MSRVFVTGASSALGQTVVELLAQRHHIVALQHRTEVVGAHEIVVGSIGDVAAYRTAAMSCDVVVHLAAVTHAAQVADYDRANVQGTASLLSACRPDAHIVFVSSRAAVPGGGAYSESKRNGEQLVRAHRHDSTILRVGEVVAPGADEGLAKLLMLARSRRLLIDLRAKPPITFAPISLEAAAHCVAVSVDRRPDGVIVVAGADAVSTRDIQAAIGDVGRRPWRVPVPVAFLRFLRPLLAPRFFAADQIERLVVEKPVADRHRLAELGIESQSLSELIATLA